MTMLTAITREVSPSLDQCELTHLERIPIDVELARHQHQRYCDCLRQLGLRLLKLPAAPDLPDAVFVEDPAVVLDEVAVITRPGAASRRPERDSLAAALEQFRPLQWMTAPATLDGGDVFLVDRTLYVGHSARTSDAGIDQLRRLVAPYDYDVTVLMLRDCLHLKSACCPLGEGRVLVNRAWLAPDSVTRLATALELVDIPPAEPHAANVLAIGRRVLLPAAHPRTAALLEEQGFGVLTVDNSELLKAESGITCSSLVFASDAPLPEGL